jgi:TPR repeat protein
MCRTKMTKNQMTSNRALGGLIEEVVIQCPTALDKTPDSSSSSASSVEVKELQKKKIRKQKQLALSSASQNETVIEKCKWKGAVKDAKLHLASCLNAVVTCSNDGCDVQVMRLELKKHTDKCAERVISCVLCQEGVKFRLHKTQNLTCEMRLVPCSNGCLDDLTGQTSVIPLRHLSQHRSECPEERICCLYSSVGCNVLVLRKDMAAHQGDMAAHFSTFMTTMIEQQKSVAQQQQINSQQQTRILDLEKRAGRHYVSLLNLCVCGKLDAWRQLKDMADGGDKIAQIYKMILHQIESSIAVSQSDDVAQALAVALMPWMRAEGAAGGSNVHALYGLAYCYEYGLGVAIDLEEAFIWFKLTVDQGHTHAAAQNDVGICYEDGKGVAVDMDEALKWYRLSADQGDADAQNNVGNFYGCDNGVAVDLVEALKWYRLAADQGHAAAQFSVGYCYQNGDGVAVDVNEALKWFRLSADQGDADAQECVDRLE